MQLNILLNIHTDTHKLNLVDFDYAFDQCGQTEAPKRRKLSYEKNDDVENG